jgi:2-amino-4-hydroxy-6-hydroxymethyldihydropteridine diphosphokinase
LIILKWKRAGKNDSNQGKCGMAIAFLGLGSNLADKMANIIKAIEKIGDIPGLKIKAVSSLYSGIAVGVTNQPDFANAVIKIETSLDPHSLLKTMQAIEISLGKRPHSHNEPRLMDIDILLYDDVIMDSLELMIPHSRLLKRRFVLEPLVEIDPELREPESGVALKSYLNVVKSQQLEKIAEAKTLWSKAG